MLFDKSAFNNTCTLQQSLQYFHVKILHPDRQLTGIAYSFYHERVTTDNYQYSGQTTGTSETCLAQWTIVIWMAGSLLDYFLGTSERHYGYMTGILCTEDQSYKEVFDQFYRA